MKKIITLIIMSLILFKGKSLYGQSLEQIKLPAGFKIEVYADGINTARSMAFSPAGILYVGSKKGAVYAITPQKKIFVVKSSLNMPVGVDYGGGNLYVSEVSRIIMFKDIDNNYHLNPDFVVINDSFPDDQWHGWKFIKIGPDQKIYVPVGAPCNVCLKKDKRYASIMRMNLDGSQLEIFGEGIRNSVGFDWHPQTKELWFTENGRDRLGDDLPPDELNRAFEQGLHYGFPYYHGRSIKDPQFGDLLNKRKIIAPQLELPAHVAALGMRFYTGNHFPAYYQGGIFIAEHGSWNRSKKIGYRVSFVKLEKNKPVTYQIFASGWMKDEKVWGRPADVEVSADGSLLVSDDFAHKIYRIFYTGNQN